MHPIHYSNDNVKTVTVLKTDFLYLCNNVFFLYIDFGMKYDQDVFSQRYWMTHVDSIVSAAFDRYGLIFCIFPGVQVFSRITHHQRLTEALLSLPLWPDATWIVTVTTPSKDLNQCNSLWCWNLIQTQLVHVQCFVIHQSWVNGKGFAS